MQLGKSSYPVASSRILSIERFFHGSERIRFVLDDICAVIVNPAVYHGWYDATAGLLA